MKERMIADRQIVADTVAKDMIKELQEHTAKLRAEMKYEGEASHGNKAPSSTSKPQRNVVAKE